MTETPAPRAPGVREVAAAAGVSRQTVSRVLNDSPSIRPETRERVLAAMAELQFRPNRAARMLTTARSHTIGVLASSASSLYGPASSLDAVENAAREAGYFVTVAHAASPAREEILAALEHLVDQSVDGMVVIAPQQRVQDAMASVSFGVPTVELHGAGDADGLAVDQAEGARLAVRHLVSRGHRRILHVCGPLDWAEARARREGFLLEAEATGAEGSVSREGDWTAASGAQIAAEHLPGRGITAVFSSNDQMALGVLHGARKAGLRVPEDLAVVGFDDIPEAAFFAPPLTTVRQDFAELGHRAVARLVALVEGRDVAFAEPVAPTLVKRESA
ncbi:LacI family DNA-binding transcriptional regulator [Sinomonas terrae]|uniref:LacI family DNA-binding transcriptional regulator n=1 Tax=Sinomonas terrae TaxID=2908838 RepID=A0ABS9TYG4_9MICC|nr:LacI family DNA-binding transcriptional regulator [Sinomonas terrae]MCH6469503.1 LacI family DNA-binding transcriptional regulator [Sinomonas terrae]